jgi:adenylate cyclase class IV
MKPEDILKENENFVTIQGQEIRKGSIGAFMENCKIINQDNQSSEEYKTAIEDIKEQAGLLKKIGLFDIFEIKSSRLREIIGVN